MNEIILLHTLLRQGLLTPDQAKRVERVLKAGKSLVEAIQSVPLVEPIAFLRAQQESTRVPATPRPESMTPIPAQETAEARRRMIDGILRDSDDKINVLELVEEDTPSRVPVGFRAETWSGNLGPGVITVPSDAASFLAGGEAPGTFDLADDEGIRLIRDVNSMLREAVAGRLGGLLVQVEGQGGFVADYDQGGKRIGSRTMEESEAEKFATRLKVMARIQPWRQDTVRGAFHFLVKSTTHTALVESVPGQRESTVTVFLRSGKT